MLLIGMTDIDAAAQLMTTLFIFLFVLAITWFVTRWIANYQKGRTFNNNIQIIETSRISNSKCIQVVRVGNKYIAIAVCKDTVTFLMEVPEESLQIQSELPPKVDFQSFLDQAKTLTKKK